MKLYVDDVRNPPPGWIVARTIEEAKKFLLSGEVEECSLDHDMGTCGTCPKDVQRCPHPDTSGYALCRWMAETGKWPKKKPVIHSMNPVGKCRMFAIIEDYWDEK